MKKTVILLACMLVALVGYMIAIEYEIKPKEQTRTKESLTEQIIADQKTQELKELSDIELFDKAYEQKNYQKAYQISKKACDNGDIAGCHRFGLLYSNGHGVEKNKNISFKLFEMSCNGGYARGCLALGLQYEAGEGISKDSKIALSLYEKACNSSIKLCNDLGVMYNLKQNYKKASDFFKKACENNNASACNNLGILYANGTGVRIDKNIAKEYFGKACDIGLELGCENYKNIEAK